nr:RNA-binding protein cabeza-like [Aegilops tauschii subsp. strangulata]
MAGRGQGARCGRRPWTSWRSASGRGEGTWCAGGVRVWNGVCAHAGRCRGRERVRETEGGEEEAEAHRGHRERAMERGEEAGDVATQGRTTARSGWGWRSGVGDVVQRRQRRGGVVEAALRAAGWTAKGVGGGAGFDPLVPIQIGIESREENQQKEANWEKICAFEEHKITLEEQKRKDNKIIEEDRFLMMYSNGMKPMAREFWELKRMEIMFQRRQELHDLMGGGCGGALANGGGGDASTNGGGCGGASGNGGDGSSSNVDDGGAMAGGGGDDLVNNGLASFDHV